MIVVLTVRRKRGFAPFSFRRLRPRELPKVWLHAAMSVLVMSASVMAKVQVDRLGELSACTRKVA